MVRDAVRRQSKCWPWEAFSAVLETDYGRDRDCGTACSSLRSTVGLPHIAVVGSVELHNRQELVTSLGIARAVAENCHDLSLLAYAYERWGDKLPQQLEGQFAFALRDSRQGRVLACTDHLGSLPLLYRQQGQSLVVAGDMRTMLRTEGCPRELNVTALRAFGDFDTLPAEAGECLHKGIYALPPGSILVTSGSDLRIRSYWTPTIRPDLVSRNEREIYERVRQLTEIAVEKRLAGRRRVAVMVSGGLDSSALVAAAAPWLRRKGLTLLAIGAVNDPDHGHVPDERCYMEKLRYFDNVELAFVDSAGKGPFDGLGDPTLFETTPRLPGLRYLFDSVFQAASSPGTELLLHGGGGEMGVSGTPAARFLEHLTRFRGLTLCRELRQTSANRGISGVRLFGGEMRQYFGRPLDRSAFLLNPAFQNGAPKRTRRYPPLWPDSGEAELRTMANVRDRCAIRACLPPEYVTGYSCPLNDKDLIEYCLAVPAVFKSREGYGRYLVRKAFESILPPELSWRRHQMQGSPDYALRYNRQLGGVREFVRGLRKSDPVREVVDVDELARHLQPMSDLGCPPGRPTIQSKSVAGVPTTVNLVHFLRQFSGFRI
jgi:asparagine synthase (glutamine-hydrolysing)